MKKRLIVLLIVSIVTIISVSAAVAVSNHRETDEVKQTNSLAFIYDEGVYIPEPDNKDIEVPNDVYWEPMIGCYVSDELIYNPKTRRFEEVLDNVDPSELGEIHRELDWWENEFNKNNEIHIAMRLMWDNWAPSEKMYTIIEQDSFQNHIVPLGINAIDNFLEFAIDKNIFNMVSLSAVGVIGQINCTEWHKYGVDSVAMDDNKQHHELWKANFTELMSDLKAGIIDIESEEKYGVFILPHLRDTYDENKEMVNSIIKSKFNIKSNTSLETATTTSRFFDKNEEEIDLLEDMINKYGN